MASRESAGTQRRKRDRPNPDDQTHLESLRFVKRIPFTMS